MSDEFWKNLPLSLTALSSIIATILGFWNARLIKAVHQETARVKELVKTNGHEAHELGVKRDKEREQDRRH